MLQCVKHAYLFEPPRKNRRFTPPEYELELTMAKNFRRPPRQYFYDPPFYPWLPPEPVVNFDLNYKK